MSFKLCIQFLFNASRAQNCTKLLLFLSIPFESTPPCFSHILAGNGITRTSGAPVLASLLSNLTALRILDISGAFAPVKFNSSPHPHPDNNIVAFPDYPTRYLETEEMAAAVQPFALSLARLRDLESLNVSGVRATAVSHIYDCSSLVRCSRAALAPQSQNRMCCCNVTIQLCFSCVYSCMCRLWSGLLLSLFHHFSCCEAASQRIQTYFPRLRLRTSLDNDLA